MGRFSKASINLFRLLNLRGVGPAKIHTILDSLRSLGASPSNSLDDASLLNEILTRDQIDAYLFSTEDIQQLLIRLEENNVNLLNVMEHKYPQRLAAILGRQAPPLLMVKGNEDLLNKLSVGFCGSRKASDKGLRTAADCAEQLAKQGLNINAGYAAGVDTVTHRAALECGGTTTLVIAEGILNFKVKKNIEDLWDWNRTCVVSEFLPMIPWSVRNAMQRNKIICGLSSGMILIEAGKTGGSMAAGKACLKMGIPLFAPVYEGMPEFAIGNQELIGEGARRILKNRVTNRANLTEVILAVNQAGDNQNKQSKPYEIPQERTEQLGLFENMGGK